MSDNLSVCEAQIAGSKIKCSDSVSEKQLLFGENKRAIKMDPVSPGPGREQP